MSLPRWGTKMADAAFPRIPKTNKQKITIILIINASFFFTFKMVPISPPELEGGGWYSLYPSNLHIII